MNIPMIEDFAFDRVVGFVTSSRDDVGSVPSQLYLVEAHTLRRPY